MSEVSFNLWLLTTEICSNYICCPYRHTTKTSRPCLLSFKFIGHALLIRRFKIRDRSLSLDVFTHVLKYHRPTGSITVPTVTRVGGQNKLKRFSSFLRCIYTSRVPPFRIPRGLNNKLGYSSKLLSVTSDDFLGHTKSIRLR